MEEQKNENVETVKQEVKTETKKENSKKSKTGLIIAIILIVVAVIIAIALFIGYHIYQTVLLTEEVNKMTSEDFVKSEGTINENAKIDMEIKTSGSYAVVEKTLKEYLNETLELAKNQPTEMLEEEIQKLVDFENIRNDAPEFTQTKAKIAAMKKTGEEYIDKFIELCNKENLLSRIENENVSDYYKELYKKLAMDEVSEKELEDVIVELENSKKQLTSGFEYIENMLNFLSEHKSDWTIIGNQIMFYRQSVLDQYQELVSNVPEDIQ